MHAANLGDAGSVTILLEPGADINMVSKYGRTALFEAAERRPCSYFRLKEQNRTPGETKAPPHYIRRRKRAEKKSCSSWQRQVGSEVC